MFIFWFLTALLFLVLELGHPGLLFFISFACGAGVAGIASFMIQDLVLQGAIFLVTTIGALICLKRWVMARGLRTPKHGASNVYALTGKHGVVIKAMSPIQAGQVKLNGEIWMARPLHEVTISVGSEVVVRYVKGAHVVVEESSQSKN